MSAYPVHTIKLRPSIHERINAEMLAARASGNYNNTSWSDLRSIVLDGILRKHYGVDAT